MMGMFVGFSFYRRMAYMIFGTGLMIEPGNYSYITTSRCFIMIELFLFETLYLIYWIGLLYKVSSRPCYWWNCLPWVNLDSRHHMVVGILELIDYLCIISFFAYAFLNIYPWYGSSVETLEVAGIFANSFCLCTFASGYWIPWIFLCQWRQFVCSLHLYFLLLLRGQLTF